MGSTSLYYDINGKIIIAYDPRRPKDYVLFIGNDGDSVYIPARVLKAVGITASVKNIERIIEDELGTFNSSTIKDLLEEHSLTMNDLGLAMVQARIEEEKRRENLA